MNGRLDPAVAAVRRSVRQVLADLEPGTQLLLACSGGADSMALAAATLFEARTAGWLVDAAVVDHGLQPDSTAVADAVAGRLRRLGAERVAVLAVRVGADGGPEAAARDARYAALRASARESGAIILLGHTLDDQAESVLLGLARGSGTRSLAGMPPLLPDLRRPLLGITREQTRQACSAEGIEVWDDPHNADRRFLRARVRHDVLPVLEDQLGPGVTGALARTADAARRDADALDQLAAELYASAVVGSGRLRMAPIERALPAMRRRVLRRAALDAGAPAGDLFAVHVDGLESLVVRWRGQDGIDLPGGLLARREGDTLVIAARGQQSDASPAVGL